MSSTRVFQNNGLFPIDWNPQYRSGKKKFSSLPYTKLNNSFDQFQSNNFFQANKERDQVLENNVLSSGDSGVGDTTTGGQSASGTSDCESGSTEKCANERGHPYPMFERQGSFINRERMIAHSTALESITINVDPTAASSHPGCAEDDEGKKLS